MVNKAHTAVVRRILERYGGVSGDAQGVDIAANGLLIEVETTATLAEGFARLKELEGIRYVAITNKEAIEEALRLVKGTGIGVMDSHGNVLQVADGHQDAANYD